MDFHIPRPTRIMQFLKDSEQKITLSRGGTRSGKTYSTCLLAVLWLMTGEFYKGKVWSIVRATLPALKSSAYRDVLDILDKLGVSEMVQHNRTELTFKYEDRFIEFFSLDDVNKVKSRKRDICHVVECNEINYDMFVQLDIRTKEKIILDWNPSEVTAWMKVEIEDKRMHLKKDVDLLKSTYRDNPYLEQSERESIEYLAEVDPELWAVYGNGEYGKITDLIFQQFTLEEYDETSEYQYIGIDFGFSIDPATAILVGRTGNNIYLKELVYSKGLLNSDLAELLEPYKSYSMVADSAEPKSITELNGYGLNVAKAEKGPDSIRAGINTMKTFKIHIDPSSVNLIKEFNSYKWSDKKAGVPIDAYNHGIDASRYVITKYFRNNGSFRFGGVVSNSNTMRGTR